MGTFTKDKEFPTLPLKKIFESFAVNKVFVFECYEEQEYLLTFNILKEDKQLNYKDYQFQFPNTIQLHRSKDDGILYTINSLNYIIKEQNKGVLNKNYKVDWKKYENCCLIVSEGELKPIFIKLKNIVKY